jgi:hypothetical protein
MEVLENPKTKKKYINILYNGTTIPRYSFKPISLFTKDLEKFISANKKQLEEINHQQRKQAKST